MSDIVGRLNVALRDRYRVERQLGVGGMARVYVGEDLRHERRVALKVLKPELATVIGAGRFLAEIRTTANLQHPHILPLHDSGEVDGLPFYVMPYVDGESLRTRLDGEHQLPVDEAVDIASKVAGALGHAHHRGVVHRDIKPANILLLDGEPVVSDFGIALAVSAGGGDRLTETGLSLGTPHYMSPEQATGDQTVGPATDIWALGCVLHEMLAGEPPYTGGTPQSILGKIITADPPSITADRTSVPPNVEAAITRALEKVPADRFPEATDFADALGDPAFRHGRPHTPATATPPARARRIIVALAASTISLAVLSVWLLLAEPQDPPRGGVERFSVEAAGASGAGSVGVSTQGSAMVFVGSAEGGERRLWLRRWGDLTPVPIPGTEGTTVASPALSPDATAVAFVADRQLKAVLLDGGAVRTLADSVPCCPRWGSDGFIYYPRVGSGIERVPASGGPAESVTRLAPDERAHTDLEVIPGGEVAVFTVTAGLLEPRIEAVHLGTGERTFLTRGQHPHVTPTGHLVFGSQDGEILAAPLDAAELALSDTPTRLYDGVYTPFGVPRTTFGLSTSGRLVYLRALGGVEDRYEFVWLSRDGVPTLVDPELDLALRYSSWRLAPDEESFAFNGVVGGNNDVYVKHLPDGPVDRMTTGEYPDIYPFWTPDSNRILYFTGPALDGLELWSIRADGGEPEVVLDDERGFVSGSSGPAGDWLVLRTAAIEAQGIGLRDVMGFRPGVDSAAFPLLADPQFQEVDPEISPDGRWLAYVSNRTGRREVYVRPFPDVRSGGRVAISRRGGVSPRWAAEGAELLFLSLDGTLVSTNFDPVAGEVLGQEALFALPRGLGTYVDRFDVTSDGQRFLMARQRRDEDPLSPQLVVVQSFFEELRERVPN